MHVISRFNERVLLKIRGKTCYSLWLNKWGLLSAWMLGQNQQANAQCGASYLELPAKNKGGNKQPHAD